MPIVQTLTKSAFIDAFKQSSRKNQFSYAALEAIFDYLEDYSYSTDEPVEFDLIGICCEWAEAHWSTIAIDYSIDLGDFWGDEDDDNRIRAVSEYLEDRTTVIDLGEGNFVYVQF